MRPAAIAPLLLLPLAAQDPGAHTRSALIRAANDITRQAALEVASKDAWEPLRARRREEVRDMLGLLPWPERPPLHVSITGTLEEPGYKVEKLAFESAPKLYVTANLYLFRQPSGRVPALVYVCGHSYSPDGAKVQYQRHGIIPAGVY